MRIPKIKNKYIKPKDIQNAIVLDKNKIMQPPFWRNDVIGAWCLLDNTCKTQYDRLFCTYNEYWIGFYDDNAESHAGEIKLTCSSYGGMCGYNFNEFFDPKEIEDEKDLEIQEKLLSRINWLIDQGIILIE
jgi:hypothetical protein